MTCHFCQATARRAGTYGKNRIQRYRCLTCGRTWSDKPESHLDEMRVDFAKAVHVINLLVEGVGIRAAARIAGINKRTVLRLLVLIGERCEKLMDSRMRNLALADIQCDEIWGFVGKKQRHLKATDNADLLGDTYTFVAIDRHTKLVITYLVGKRNAPSTQHFMADLADRLVVRPQVSTDSFGAYQFATRRAFNGDVDHGVIQKIYAGNLEGGSGRYSPPACIGAVRKTITGQPIEEHICTSHVERSNLNMRTFMRRLTRLCLGFSKKIENLRYAVALYFAWSNFVRVHATINTTPAVASGITDHVWTLEELLIASTR